MSRTIHPESRLELPAVASGSSGMDVSAAIRERRAVRSYSDRNVDREEILRLVGEAIQAPSAMDLEPWAFVVLEGSDRLRRLSDDVKQELLQGSHAPPALRERLADPAFNIFYGAPVLVVICATSGTTQAAEDCCLAAQNLMLAAYAAGLATCPIGLARAWLNEPATKRRLGIPSEYVPVFPVIVGYPGERPAPPGRRASRVLWV